MNETSGHHPREIHPLAVSSAVLGVMILALGILWVRSWYWTDYLVVRLGDWGLLIVSTSSSLLIGCGGVDASMTERFYNDSEPVRTAEIDYTGSVGMTNDNAECRISLSLPLLIALVLIALGISIYRTHRRRSREPRASS